MLRLMLGEVLEAKRFFDQALEGRHGPARAPRRRHGHEGEGPLHAVDRDSSSVRLPASSFPLPASGSRLALVVVIAFGSNLGDRHTIIREAADKVAALLASFRLSPIIETQPVGEGLENDPAYLNAVAVGESALSPQELLRKARDRSRPRPAGHRSTPGAPRTLDLDLILAGDGVVDERVCRSRIPDSVNGCSCWNRWPRSLRTSSIP